MIRKHRTIHVNQLVLAGILALGILGSGLASAVTPPTLEKRLERVAERLEQARIEQHIPGLAIAIVKDDRVVFAQGLGVADLGKR